jgi:hypothetical protein
MVAQKPAGNFNPLSLLGHSWLLVPAPGRPDANELLTDNAPSAAMAGSNVLSKLENRMYDLLSIELTAYSNNFATDSLLASMARHQLVQPGIRLQLMARLPFFSPCLLVAMAASPALFRSRSLAESPDEACAACHREIYDSYQRTPMARASGVPSTACCQGDSDGR